MGIEPRGDDHTPSPIGPGMVTAVEDSTCVLRPVLRKGWLNGLPHADDTARGMDACVEVSRDDVLTLVSGDLRRARSQHGDRAVFGGSCGRASAGGFHNAQGRLQRFLVLGGGHTDSRGTYSTAALEVILPHVIGGAPWSYQSGCRCGTRSPRAGGGVWRAAPEEQPGQPWRTGQASDAGPAAKVPGGRGAVRERQPSPQ
ncbi:hypothetical protein [Streptomyces sp. NPDC014656]|uniref:hypothetical protein n=1 Tax=Streptomyces sp. NPDC014656 TaxID=3364878 RepID=UPI0036F69112